MIKPSPQWPPCHTTYLSCGITRSEITIRKLLRWITLKICSKDYNVVQKKPSSFQKGGDRHAVRDRGGEKDLQKNKINLNTNETPTVS